MSKNSELCRQPAYAFRHASSGRIGAIRRLRLEPLESRRVLDTTIFLDLAAGIGFGTEGIPNTLIATGTEIRNIDGIGDHGHGTGPDILDQTGAPLSTSLEFRPLAYDFNHDGNLDESDLTDLADAVVPIMERALEPFDIDVVVTSAASLADIVATWNSNASADAYLFVADVVSDIDGGGQFGEWAGIYGVAAGDDIRTQDGNNQDELALGFADTFLSRISETPGSAEYDAGLAHQVARIAIHEAFHTFTLVHTFPAGKEGLLSRGDVVRCGCISFFEPAWTKPTIVTRFPIEDFDDNTPHGVGVNNYVKVAEIIGLRDDDNRGIPDLAYVTGTGGNEEITISLKPESSTTVDVIVSTFEDPARTIFYRGITYPIDLTTDTDDEILVDLSWGDDRVEIDSSIAASFRIRGMEGNDEIAIIGNDQSALRALSIEGEAGDDTLTFDFESGDPLPRAGSSFVFRGGDGDDRMTVVDEQGTTRPAFYVDASRNINASLPNKAVTNRTDLAEVTSPNDSDLNPLRVAIQQANDAGEAAYVFLPNTTTSLALDDDVGVGGGDLTITGDVSVIGTGAGTTIIEIDSALNNTRHFEVAGTGKLELRRLTLTGGSETNGGSIRVAPNNSHTTALTMHEVAVADNGNGHGVGGALYVGENSDVVINKSVITNNRALSEGGGIYAEGGSEVRLIDSIVAKNDAPLGTPDIASAGPTGNHGEFIVEGNVLIGDWGSAQHASPLVASDDTSLDIHNVVVVTSVGDSFDATNDAHSMSLRDAIHETNRTTTANEIWLPAWKFTLTRDRATYGGGSAADIDIAFGDLDITKSLTIRSAGFGIPLVTWKHGTVDEVFDLWGDLDDNGINLHGDGDSDGADFFTWQRQFNDTGSWEENFSADEDDDGDVDGGDLDFITDHFGNMLAFVL